MNKYISADMPAVRRVTAGADREGESRGLGKSTITWKCERLDAI